jgi:estrone sulfotransferase
MMSTFRSTPYYQQLVRLIRGKYYYDPFFPQVSPGEIYLVSFPRSGSTWLRCLLTSLIHGSPVSPQLVQATIPDIYVSRFRGLPKPDIKPLIVKTHARFTGIPAKVVYLIRDGRQALLSFYAYTQTAGVFQNRNRSLPDFFFDENLYPAPWHVHVQDWLQGMLTWDPARYQFIRYEDLVASPVETLEAVTHFIGINTTALEREQAVAWNTSSLLHTIEQQAGSGTLNYVRNVRPADLKEALTAQQIAQYEVLAGPLLRRLGYICELKSDNESDRLLRINNALSTSD